MFKWLKKNYPLFVIIGACVIIYHFFGEKEDYVSEYNAKIKALEAKVDSLHAENSELVNESKLLEVKIAEYDAKINTTIVICIINTTFNNSLVEIFVILSNIEYVSVSTTSSTSLISATIFCSSE